MITIGYHRLPHGEGLQLPAYASEDAAGMDLVAALPGVKRLSWPRIAGVDRDRDGYRTAKGI